MRPLFPLLFLAAAPGAAAPSAPALLNPEVISSAYPEASRRAHEQGVVRVRLAVSPEGRAAGCEIVESSGFPRLDEETCAAFIGQARFRPARDARGRPVASSAMQAVLWRLEENAADDGLENALNRVLSAPGLSDAGVAVIRAEAAVWGAGLVPPGAAWRLELEKQSEELLRLLGGSSPADPRVASARAAVMRMDAEFMQLQNGLLDAMLRRLGPGDSAALARAVLAWSDDDVAQKRESLTGREAEFVEERERVIAATGISHEGGDVVRRLTRFLDVEAGDARLNAAWRAVWAAVADTPADPVRRAAALQAMSRARIEDTRRDAERYGRIAARMSAEDRRRYFRLEGFDEAAGVVPDALRREADALLAAPGLSPVGRAMLRPGLIAGGELSTGDNTAQFKRIGRDMDAVMVMEQPDMARFDALARESAEETRERVRRREQARAALFARLPAADRAAYAAHRRSALDARIAREADGAVGTERGDEAARRLTTSARGRALWREAWRPLNTAVLASLKALRAVYDAQARGADGELPALQEALVSAHVALMEAEDALKRRITAELGASERRHYVATAPPVNAEAVGTP